MKIEDKQLLINYLLSEATKVEDLDLNTQEIGYAMLCRKCLLNDDGRLYSVILDEKMKSNILAYLFIDVRNCVYLRVIKHTGIHDIMLFVADYYTFLAFNNKTGLRRYIYQYCPDYITLQTKEEDEK